MPKNVKFSVIIPTFNNAKGIKKCLGNFSKIDYSNYEIIVINDGSTDNTEEILGGITNKKLQIVTTENRGVSSARNTGMSLASGDYMVFMDDDDEIKKDSLKILNERIRQLGYPRVLRFGGYKETASGELREIRNFNNKDKLGMIGSSEAIEQIIMAKNGIDCYVWLLAIKKDTPCRFNENLRYLEDEAFYLELLKRNEKISFSNDTLYIYKYNIFSKTKNSKKFKNNIDDIILARNAIRSGLSKKQRSIYDARITHLIYTRVCYYCGILHTRKEMSEIVRYAGSRLRNSGIKLSAGFGFRNIIEWVIIMEPTGLIMAYWRKMRK